MYLRPVRISRTRVYRPCLGPFQDAVLWNASVIGGKRARREYGVSVHEYERWRQWARKRDG